MKFQFKADVVFEAEDLDDAFNKIASHFLELAGDEDAASLDMLAGGFDLHRLALRQRTEQERGA
ncbi:hypothetical protein [Castellaniella sp.]|uniref:hypothetical protein n=1 Tax=Castellaniella sp. TaxID=1955812 RepID=UPI002AFE67BD|nr:hypothetical protein [Castellaniella sp.]